MINAKTEAAAMAPMVSSFPARAGLAASGLSARAAVSVAIMADRADSLKKLRVMSCPFLLAGIAPGKIEVRQGWSGWRRTNNNAPSLSHIAGSRAV
ncbi:hypothetical protein STA1M1_01830 [Sinisalibacter aestuarii]|uniref:Uncharacterized protein n=1 Tax=Sinisalibacter aestuarii TaxID=2949426 RepID=A0ABQ5LMR1_9RHOB|nr:hypothetical protein STA1M1_01830 [Sinisalibacter aestuarii]